MSNKVTSAFVSGKLPGLNDYVDACRENRFKAAKMKREVEHLIHIQTLRLSPITSKIFVRLTWYEETARRDPDNVCFAKKFILDAFQKSGKLQNDNSKWIAGFSDRFVYGKGQGVLIEVIDDEI